MNSHVRHVRCGCLDCFSTTVADSHNLSCSLYSFISFFVVKCVRGELSLHLGQSPFENVKKRSGCSWRWIGLICHGQCTPRAAESILPLVTASRPWWSELA